MRCETVRRLLDAYAEGNLDSEKARSLANHLHRCPDCQKRWGEIQKLLWLLDDAFADFCPIPSPTLKQRIEQKIAAQKPLTRRRVIALRSQAIFAIAAVILIWFAVTFVHQPFIVTTENASKVETATKIGKTEKSSLSQQLQKLEQQTERLAMSIVKQPVAKRRVISTQKVNVKVETRKRFDLPKAARTSKESEAQSHEQMSAPYEPPTETLDEIETQPKTVLIRFERVVSLNPAEPTPEIFVYRALSAPTIQEVSVPLSQGAIVQPITVAEIPMPLPMQP